MGKNDLDILLEDFFALRTQSSDDELTAVEAALFIEECFGIVLSDTDISAERLGTAEKIRELVMIRAVI